MQDVPVDWEWEFGVRTDLLDCGGLCALGDVLAETETHKISCGFLSRKFISQIMSKHIHVLTSINGTTSIRQRMGERVGMRNCVSVWSRGAGRRWGSSSRCSGGWSSRWGRSVGTYRVRARARTRTALRMMWSIGPTTARQRAIPLWGGGARLGASGWR